MRLGWQVGGGARLTEQIYNYQAQGAYVRSRAVYKIEGEKPTKMFCALEKHNGTQKYVPQLIVENNGQEYNITNQKGVEQEIYKFYKHLYKNKDDNIMFDSIDQFIGQDNISDNIKLSERQKESMEGKITVNELTYLP